MTEEYVEENNIQLILTDYSNLIFTTAIHKYFDENFHINRTFKINATTLKNYIRNFILMLKYKFTNHCA